MDSPERAAEYLRLRDTAPDLATAEAGFARIATGLSAAQVAELSRRCGYTPDRTRKATLSRLYSNLCASVSHRQRSELIRKFC